MDKTPVLFVAFMGTAGTFIFGRSVQIPSDTLTCITGGIAQAFYGGVPKAIQEQVYAIMDEPLGIGYPRFYGEILHPLGR